MQEKKSTPASKKQTRCRDCRKLTDAGPCPGCGVVICQLCAECEGEFCCDGPAAKPQGRCECVGAELGLGTRLIARGLTTFPSLTRSRKYEVGDELTQNGALVERVIAVEPGRFTLRALYLDRRFATEIVRSDLADYRQALEADHDTARAYARRFNEDESDEALAAWMHKKGGGAMAKTTRSTMDQPVKRKRKRKRKREQLAFSFMAGPASAPFSAGTGAKGARKRAKLPAVPGQIPAVASPPPRAKSHLSIVRDRAGLPAAVILGGSKHGK